jgi:hypothetical protein
MNGEMGINDSKAIENAHHYVRLYIYMAIGGTKGC